jgi:hypothetical protein
MASSPGPVAAAVFDALKEAPLGAVVAVWCDGSTSTHGSLAFRHRKRPDGRLEAPVTSFVARTDLPSVWEIESRLERTSRRGA